MAEQYHELNRSQLDEKTEEGKILIYKEENDGYLSLACPYFGVSLKAKADIETLIGKLKELILLSSIGTSRQEEAIIVTGNCTNNFFETIEYRGKYPYALRPRGGFPY